MLYKYFTTSIMELYELGVYSCNNRNCYIHALYELGVSSCNNSNCYIQGVSKVMAIHLNINYKKTINGMIINFTPCYSLIF